MKEKEEARAARREKAKGADVSKEPFRTGTVAIVGRPNVGKSTLLNHLVGAHVAITSRKAQTTRHRLQGIHTDSRSQFIFVDTPGYQTQHANALNRWMNRTVGQVASEVDVVVFVIDAHGWDPRDEPLLELIPEFRGIDDIAIVRQGESAQGEISNDGLHIFQDAASCCRISVMSDGYMPGQSLEPLLGKYVRNKTHGFFRIKLFPIGGAYAGTFLTSVLQGVKTEVGEVGRLRVIEYSKYSALLTNIVKEAGRCMRTDGLFQFHNCLL